ncbi:MAG: TolC family protein [Bacteroidales bacterium]|nr:TolC family protein [Bacteroidales bacterium]
MKSIFILIFLVFFVSIIKLYSQIEETNAFTLNEAKNYALEHNILIKNSKLNIVLSEKKVWEAIAQGLPQADLTVDYTDFFDYEIEFGFGGSTSEPPVLDYDLLDAGDLEVLKLLEGLMEPSGSSVIVMDNSSSAKFQISQLIFNGQYFIGIKTAKIAKKITEQSLFKTQKDVKELVTTAYYLVLITDESLKILDNNLSNLEKSITHSEALLKAGMAEQFDIDQIKITLSMLKNTKNAMKRNLELNYNMLRFQLGIEHDKTFALTDSLKNIIEKADAETLLLSVFNYENNINYQILSSQEQLSKKMIDMQTMSYLPTIGAFYSYNEKLLTTDFDMNPKNVAGLNLSWKLFTSNIRNVKRQQAQIDMEITKNNKYQLKEQLLLQEKQYRYNLRNNIDNYKLQKENLQLSDNIYENIKRKYSQGILSSLDLTQANDNYLKAQNTYLSSVMEVLQAKLALDKLLNKL